MSHLPSCATQLCTHSLHKANLNASRDIPLVLSAYLIWKFYKKTKIYELSEIPLMDALRQADLEEENRYRD